MIGLQRQASASSRASSRRHHTLIGVQRVCPPRLEAEEPVGRMSAPDAQLWARRDDGGVQTVRIALSG